jgi:uncharacterized protein (TIGR03435 family)
VFLLVGTPLRAQTAAPPAALTLHPAEPPAAAFAFDVATFKSTDPGIRNLGSGFNATGYRVTDFSLTRIVSSAYFPLFPQGNRVIGMPAWAENEHYDVVAHIDEATAPEWLKLTPRQRQQPGRLMLQQLLVDRCKLVAHTVPAQADGYALVVSKRGLRLVPSKPGATYPPGAKDWDGAKVFTDLTASATTISFFNATMEQLAEQLSWSWFIQDQTNLTGRYDFTIRQLRLPVDAEGKRIPDPQPYDLWDISATGLELKPAKIPSQNLVIDHIERPSPN